MPVETILIEIPLSRPALAALCRSLAGVLAGKLESRNLAWRELTVTLGDRTKTIHSASPLAPEKLASRLSELVFSLDPDEFPVRLTATLDGLSPVPMRQITFVAREPPRAANRASEGSAEVGSSPPPKAAGVCTKASPSFAGGEDSLRQQRLRGVIAAVEAKHPSALFAGASLEVSRRERMLSYYDPWRNGWRPPR